MNRLEELELLKAAMAIAVADGTISRSEKGVLQGLAERVGVGSVSYDAMLEAAKSPDSVAGMVLLKSKETAAKAVELLVAHARIDGEICAAEREIIVDVACRVGITGDAFQGVYQAGIARADAIRKSRQR